MADEPIDQPSDEDLPPGGSGGPDASAPPPGGDSQPIAIEDEVRSSFLAYAMSVIISRALPDVRDGLKPVHRRILYAMNQEGLLSNRPYSKSAGVVGEVLKHYSCTFDDVIVENVFTTDMAKFLEVSSYRSSIYTKQFPTGSWLEVKGLALPEFMIEIELEAHISR